ncbi:uncharacterized protein LOC110429650 isoform X2 [Sorghum bicolor]|uniref:Uncharacterized protein n=1 Tax=Sorghum bicolor TaxID=4558 RepID=A0A1B6PEA0_SORBI|nr:uncharacterized protein LOC110429650 isoform X2 [Sorghum bicolor]KXG24030.1 hypothetical protein SORBI_3008G175400 [Sorghum bicolor]|eukprot:XP_021301594.1 uncharacterized protein LOC110429650 isoform X2 [Sorghum bicolor]
MPPTMDSSESKDGIEAGVNSPSLPLRRRAQSPRRELGRVSPARRLTMSRGELNRKHDDASSSGGGAGAAPRGKGDETKVLGGFAGSKNDGEDLLTGRRCLAAKGFKNDGAEFLGTERIFLAAKGSRNDGAEAEAEEVLGAFAGSKMANTAAAAAAERIDGAGLGALAEKAAAAFFDATPAVPHAVTLTEKRRLPSPSMARASVSSATSHSNAPQSSKRGRTSRCSGYHRSIESKGLKVNELNDVAEVTENDSGVDLVRKGVETDQWTAQKAAKTNDTTNVTSKGLGASSGKSEAVTIPHTLCERATTELVETKKIYDVNSVQNWLLERESESDENYFMRIGTGDEKKVWQRTVRACPNVFGQKFSGRRLTSLKMATNNEDIRFLCQEMKTTGLTLDMREIDSPSMQVLSKITKFLCRNCLSRDEKADKIALEMLREAVKDITDVEAIGDIPGFIATVVLRSYFGNAESQRLALHILILLSRRHQNKLKIIRLGGFGSALWHVSQQHAMMGCRLMASLMDAEEGLMKFIKDEVSVEVVNLTVKTGNVTTWISGVIEGLRDFPLGETKFLEAVGSLPPEEVFVQQRLTWCLLDFVEQNEKYCLEDTLED